VTLEEHAKVWALIAALWPHHKPTTGTIIVAEEYLVPLDFELTCAAVKILAVAEPEFAPGPGKLRKAVVELQEPTLPAELALVEVIAQVGRTGRYGAPEWSSPAVAAAVQAMGGWVAVCDSDNPEAFRAHFLRLYEPMAKRSSDEAALPASVRALAASAAVKQLGEVVGELPPAEQ
jgi:hypothetical protein